MQVKTKEIAPRSEPAAAPPEAEPAPVPKAGQAKGPRPRPPRYQMAGAGPLYQSFCVEPAAETLGAGAAVEVPITALATEQCRAAEDEAKAPHLAMVNGNAHPMLRRPAPKASALLPPVRPGSRLACERRCGGAGCDPANSHGCGGVFCLDPLEL